jgi:hypothetical protein
MWLLLLFKSIADRSANALFWAALQYVSLPTVAPFIAAQA